MRMDWICGSESQKTRSGWPLKSAIADAGICGAHWRGRPHRYMRCSCGGRLESLDHFDWVSEADRADADVRDQEEPSGHASV